MKKNSKKDIPEAPIVTGFRLKITNLRTSAYPGPLQKTDYFGFEIGDIVVKGSENTVYEVVHITRETITDRDYNRWKTVINNDTKAKVLIEEYHKNGNFGVCNVALRPIIRGEKEVLKGRLVNINEIDHTSNVRRGGIRKTTLEELRNKRISNINIIDWNLNRWSTKRVIQGNAKQILDIVIEKRTPKAPEPEHTCNRCGKEVSGELHSCPFNCEINDDCGETCNCCSNCEGNCADDI